MPGGIFDFFWAMQPVARSAAASESAAIFQRCLIMSCVPGLNRNSSEENTIYLALCPPSRPPRRNEGKLSGPRLRPGSTQSVYDPRFVEIVRGHFHAHTVTDG